MLNTNNARMYELTPTTNQKSFYGKAKVLVNSEGETLYSYDTPIIRRNIGGTFTRLWFGFSATTGKHIKAFCGMNKAEFCAL